ncbi:MAG: Glu-tRNA(Gln) amidotransferase GatDE subunit D [Candidatus Aenigmatarchaeota archaeon]|nr:MAG: Glu-tRNA(Gln) amidotransferase GatDE subunit D [Candidatus Aenigmarchaeota archaeon]
MYSKEIEKILKKFRVRVGDRIKVTKGKESYEGILMPRIELGDKDCLVLKLDNGYNLGIKFDKNTKIKLVKKGRPIKLKPAKVKTEKDSSKPTVSILGCGGTIAARVEYLTGAVFPTFSPSDLLLSFPQLKEIANLQGRKLFDLLSEDMTPHHWKIIAKEVAKEIKQKVDGIVLTHGTDTMHYTSAALSFMLQNLPIPVVLTGAQRSSDRGSSDNAMNLICSVLAAAKGKVAEVIVCMHGSISDEFCYLHQGTKVRKMHTSRRDTFRSINVLPFGKVFWLEKKIEYLRNDFRKRDKKRKAKVDTKINPNVCLVYIHPGIKPEFIESLKKFYDGVVIAATGLGHVPTNPFKDRFTKSLIPALKSLIDSGIPVVVAPQTIYGRLDLNVYTAGRLLNEVGVIGNYCDWLPEVALVKLMWVLGHTRNMKKVKELMLTNLAGEISERSEERGFLV